MKKNLFITLGLLFAGTFGISANTNFSTAPFVRANTPLNEKVMTNIPMNVVFSEDFSKFTAGTEAAPDATDISGDEANGFVIDSKYLNTPGWYGKGVHQAGGVCALKMYEYTYEGYPDVYTANGYLSTPEAELYGSVEISFRAKKITAEGKLWVGICDNEAGPTDSKNFVLTDNWVAYNFKTDKGTFKPNNVIQFSPQGKTEILIDDIVIKRAITTTEPPEVDYPVNNSFTEFVARWCKTSMADKYRLNVYKKVESPDYVKGTVKEGFDKINVKADGVSINTADPNYPEGWDINVSENGSKDMNNTAGFFYSEPRSIVFDEVGDIIISPETPAFINNIRFWIRPSSMVDEDIPSMIGVCVWDSKLKKWIAIANLPNYYFKEEGVLYEFVGDQIGLNVNKVKFDYIQKGSSAVSFSIDDIEIKYETQMVDAPVLENYETTDTFCVVKDIDPTHEHYYYVEALQGDLVSKKTSDMWVNSITGLKPEIDAPKNVTGTGFDLTWTKFWNARSYALDLSKIISAKDADMNGAVIMEEGFDKITTGTLSSPGMDWGMSYDYADHGECDTHWVSYQPQWIAGMAGTRGSNIWTGAAGFIASPALDLDCNGGAFEVELKVLTTVADDEIAVMIQPDLAQNATQFKTFKCTGNPGEYTGKVQFANGGVKGAHVSVMSLTGKPMYLDHIRIIQNLKRGETVAAPFKAYISEENEYSLSDLPKGCDYGVSVVAKGMKEFVYYTSERSDIVVVPTGAAGVENTAADTMKVFGTQGAVCVTGVPANTGVQVFNFQGQLVKAVEIDGNVAVEVGRGMYIVKVGSVAVKVFVK